MEGEIYINIGNIENNLYYLHVINNEHKFSYDISKQIYNVLISCAEVRDPNESVIIIEITPDFPFFSVIVISHDNNPNKKQYTKHDFDLEYIFQNIHKVHNKNTIKYDYETKAYFLFVEDYDIYTFNYPCYSVTHHITNKNFL